MLLILLSLLFLVISCKLFAAYDRNSGKNLTIIEEDISEENILVRLDKLCSIFGLSETERQVINEVKAIVTNPTIGAHRGGKTYNDLEFYNLLNTLGDLKVKEMVRGILDRKEFRDLDYANTNASIEEVTDLGLKQALQQSLNYKNGLYKEELKELFHNSIDNPDPDVVYKRAVHNKYVSVFADVQRDTQFIKIFIELFKGLLQHELDAVAYMQMCDTTRTSFRFNVLLGELGEQRVRRIIHFYLDVCSAKGRASRAINNITDLERKKDLDMRFKRYVIGYDQYLADAFKPTDADRVYDKMIDAQYINYFNRIEQEALNPTQSQKGGTTNPGTDVGTVQGRT